MIKSRFKHEFDQTFLPCTNQSIYTVHYQVHHFPSKYKHIYQESPISKMASMQCAHDNQNTRGFLSSTKPSTETNGQYKKSTSLRERVKGLAHSARNKLPHRHHQGSVVVVPNKAQPVAPSHTTTQNAGSNVNPVDKPHVPVASHITHEKPEFDPYHVASFNYANPPEINNYKNDTSDTESSDDSDNETSNNKIGSHVPNKEHPVTSHTQIGSPQVPNKGHPQKPNFDHPQKPQVNVTDNKKKETNYETSDLESSDESDDETSKKKY